MPAIATERQDSRHWNGGAIERRYDVSGTDSDPAARAAVLAAAPMTYEGLQRHPYIELAPVVVDEDEGTGRWTATVRYEVPGFVAFPQATTVITVDTSGGTEHITQSLATVASGGVPGFENVDTKGAIGDDGKGSVAGVDIPVPVFRFSVMKVFAVGSQPSLSAVYALTGKTNNAVFSVTDTIKSVTITLAEGECLFLGAQVAQPRGDGMVEWTFQFLAAPNRTNIVVGDCSAVNKKGFEYLWVRYQTVVADECVLPAPLFVKVERVHEPGAFSVLNLT